MGDCSPLINRIVTVARPRSMYLMSPLPREVKDRKQAPPTTQLVPFQSFQDLLPNQALYSWLQLYLILAKFNLNATLLGCVQTDFKSHVTPTAWLSQRDVSGITVTCGLEKVNSGLVTDTYKKKKKRPFLSNSSSLQGTFRVSTSILSVLPETEKQGLDPEYLGRH